MSFNQVERDLIPENLKKYCATIDISEDSGPADRSTTIGRGGVREGCQKSTILHYKVLISTLGTIGTLMNIKFPSDHFTHIIIDEAGQSVETETMIPMTLMPRNRGQVILAGDPKQLGPVLLSRINKKDEVGYGVSFLERLSMHPFYTETHGDSRSEYNSRFVTKLRKNYRSLPSVLEAYNRLFYNHELEPVIKDDESNVNEMKILQKVRGVMNVSANSDPKCGVFFCNITSGRNAREPGMTSWYNEREAAAVFKLMNRFYRAGISLKDVGIVSCYVVLFSPITWLTCVGFLSIAKLENNQSFLHSSSFSHSLSR